MFWPLEQLDGRLDQLLVSSTNAYLVVIGHVQSVQRQGAATTAFPAANAP